MRCVARTALEALGLRLTWDGLGSECGEGPGLRLRCGAGERAGEAGAQGIWGAGDRSPGVCGVLAADLELLAGVRVPLPGVLGVRSCSWA